MSLNRLFRVISIALLLLFMALAVALVGIEWGTYQRGAHSVRALMNFKLALVAFEKVSYERAPANAYLGGSESEQLAFAESVKAARADTDRAFADLIRALAKDKSHRNDAVITRLQTIQQALIPARGAIDKLSAQPLSERSDVYVSSAVSGMVDVIPVMVRSVSELAMLVDEADPELRDGLSSVRATASLREYAGQVATRLTAPLITHRPLTDEEVIEIGKLYGRIEQLRSLMETQMKGYVNRPKFRTALDELDRQYFENGFQFVDYLLQIGLKSGDYGVTPADLASRYVPRMQAITDLRDALLEDMAVQAETRNQQARNFLITVVALTIIACLFFQLLMYLIRKRVVRPLVGATDLVVGLADGNLDIAIPQAKYQDEVGGMLRALKVLKARMLERNSLAREREDLITQLQTSSNTDFLTGVLNRRAFYTYGEQQLAVAQRYDRALSIVLFDIDHFKRINDTHGHLSGDAVLRTVAQTASQLLRKVDVLARYGGEEFIILLPESDLGQAIAVAQKLRVAMEERVFDIDGGKHIHVTASFGVASLVQGQSLEQLTKLADLALYDAKQNGRNRVELRT